MQGKRGKSKWKVSTQSVYIFGREERLQSAYEIILSTERIKLKKKDCCAPGILGTAIKLRKREFKKKI